jgi:hypothetical protein
MSYRSTPSQLVGYKPLYKGRRYWIFENDTRKPFDEWTGDYKILAYDRTFDALVACGNWKSDGSIDAGILWGQGVSFEAVDLRDMVQQIISLDKHYR